MGQNCGDFCNSGHIPSALSDLEEPYSGPHYNHNSHRYLHTLTLRHVEGLKNKMRKQKIVEKSQIFIYNIDKGP
jgi:hypothetical protein